MDEQLLRKRMKELADRAYLHGTYTFSDFLDMPSVSICYQMSKEFGAIPFTAYGGMEGCERQIIRFGSSELFGYEAEFPITCIHIKPLMKKFSDDLTHRDFLGAAMNLGVERDTLGDMMIADKECLLFCIETMAEYIIENLQKVKHTNVSCQKITQIPETMQRTLEEAQETVASERIDAVISKICKLSRSQSIELFREKKIFVNARLCENNAYVLKQGDILSVRGFGKFLYDGVIAHTKKDKIRIAYQKYV